MDIRIEHIFKSYGGLKVLKDLSMCFPEGKITCIMGESGLGKTTLLRILMGLENADSGLIEGMDGRKCSAVFQDDTLCMNLTAVRNILLVCDKGVTKEEIEQQLASVGLEGVSSKPVRDLSGGMRRRVAVVRALAAQSDIVILDEPFKGLDAETRDKVIRYVRNMLKGRTLIMVTHNETEAALIGGQVIRI